MEEIAFENGRISNFQGLVTLTLDWVILHTVVHHSSTSTYIPNFIEIKETFCGRTDGRTYVSTNGRMDKHLRPALLCRLCRIVDLEMCSTDYERERPETLEAAPCDHCEFQKQNDVETWQPHVSDMAE